jgi:sugar phosphate isomerase/epimerase
LKSEGLRVAYHNHNVELSPGPEGKSGLEILLQNTDRDLVSFEMDAGWVAAAGLDPVEVLRRHPGRFELMHVKDIKATTKPNFALQQDPAEVGSGSMNWPRILPAAYAAGVRRFFVEQEPPFTRERLESIGISFSYLNGLAA